MSETADAASDLVDGTVIEIQQALIDRETTMTGAHFINYHPKHTAGSIIASNIYNSNGDIVGNVEDILVDERGKAQYFILGDGSILSFGDKKVAFEYGRIAEKSPTGAIIAQITEDLIDRKEP